MGRLFVTSDLHIGHDREFVYGVRGFSSIEEHDKTLVKNWNSVVNEDDTVYVLGDLTLRSSTSELPEDYGTNVLESLNGTIIAIRGNHDSELKVKRYEECRNIVSAGSAALYIKYPEIGGYTFYLSHYPTLVFHSHLKPMRSAVINLFGHTHQTAKFFEVDGKEHPYMYCCCLDAHNLTPVALDDVIEDVYRARCAWVNPSSDDEEVR